MIRPAFFLFFALILPASLYAQSATPMFETVIRFKDGMGNRDSVVIGYDKSVISNDTAQFHQILLNTPFDSVFEVRVVQRVMYTPWGNDDADTYKRLITGTETAVNDPSCTLGGSSIFLIRAIHQPVTIYWDRDVFDPAHCRENAFFTPDLLAQIGDPFSAWLGTSGIIYSCASKSDSMVYHLNKYVTYYDSSAFFPYISIREIENFGLDTIVGILLQFPFGNYYSPCRLVSDEEAPVPMMGNAQFILSPNPTSGAFDVRNDRHAEVQHIRLFDSIGHLVWEQSCKAVQGEFIHCYADGLPPGMYHVIATWADGAEVVRKLVKM